MQEKIISSLPAYNFPGAGAAIVNICIYHFIKHNENPVDLFIVFFFHDPACCGSGEDECVIHLRG